MQSERVIFSKSAFFVAREERGSLKIATMSNGLFVS